jgi:hypothetical protein
MTECIRGRVYVLVSDGEQKIVWYSVSTIQHHDLKRICGYLESLRQKNCSGHRCQTLPFKQDSSEGYCYMMQISDVHFYVVQRTCH